MKIDTFISYPSHTYLPAHCCSDSICDNITWQLMLIIIHSDPVGQPLIHRPSHPADPLHRATQPPKPLRVQMCVEQATKFHANAGGRRSALMTCPVCTVVPNKVTY